MRIKAKIALGFSFLFLMIVMLGTVSTVIIYRLAEQSKNTMKDNYKSVTYARQMLDVLDHLRSLQTGYFFGPANRLDTMNYNKAVCDFGTWLGLEGNNITEVGEKEHVDTLKNEFKAYVMLFAGARSEDRPDADVFFSRLEPVHNSIKARLIKVSELNMQAIERKNISVRKMASSAFMLMAFIGTICLIVALPLTVNFPGYIANPVRELTRGIRKIARKKYDERLDFKPGDEFGELAASFNDMAFRLEEYEKANFDHVLFEKKRIETIINSLEDAVLILDENKEFLFANHTAIRLAGISEFEFLGRHASEVAAENEIVRSMVGELTGPGPMTAWKDLPALRLVLDKKENFFAREIHEVKITRDAFVKPTLIGYVIMLKNVSEFIGPDLEKTVFIAAVMQKLKDPVVAIRQDLDLLESGQENAPGRGKENLLQKLQAESDLLLRLTDEIVRIAQIEAGQIKMNLQAAKPDQVIAYACDNFRPRAERAGIRLAVNARKDLPFINVDLEKTVWVLDSMLEDALKHAPVNSSISVSAETSGNAVLFRVSGAGKGIAPADRGEILEKSFRIRESIATGAGLDFAISGEFITRQGGKMWVEDLPEIGTGMCFLIHVYS